MSAERNRINMSERWHVTDQAAELCQTDLMRGGLRAIGLRQWKFLKYPYGPTEPLLIVLG
jgi:hypothetical protein